MSRKQAESSCCSKQQIPVSRVAYLHEKKVERAIISHVRYVKTSTSSRISTSFRTELLYSPYVPVGGIYPSAHAYRGTQASNLSGDSSVGIATGWMTEESGLDSQQGLQILLHSVQTDTVGDQTLFCR
jgi:hypothetical protein